MPSFLDRLAATGPSEVAALLALRPEVLADPRPRDLAELAWRLDDSYTIGQVLQRAPLGALQLAEALLALGGRARRSELAALLEHGKDERGADLGAALGWLTTRAVVRDVGPDTVEASPGLVECLPDPLRLGPPVRTLLADETADSLKRMLAALGRPARRLKAEVLQALTTSLSDAELVRRTVAQAPPDVRDWLVRTASPGEMADVFSYDPVAYRVEREAVQWAGARGLVLGRHWGYGHQMPGEVARALRGPDYRAPFVARQPAVTTHEVAARDVAAESAAAASSFLAHATAVLDRLGRNPVPLLKSGGVGAREIARLAKVTACDEADVRLVLELASACALFDVVAEGLTAGAGAGAWREHEPADRYAELVLAWWHLGMVPTDAREDGKALPALRRAGECVSCAGGRHGLLATLAALPPGLATTVVHVGPAAQWTRPLVHAQAQPDDVPYARTWAEAETMGVVARGALTNLGRHLVDGDRAALAALAAEVLPATSDEAAFGADLTVVVAGTPSARVTELLDSCADRQSRGAAVVWRLTPGSIRRALDEGVTGEQLEGALAAVARRGLPQPVSYLIGDVSRRHGSVRVRPAVSVLRSDDAALLAQIAGDRSLKRLGLALLTPTVLTSQRPDDETVTALRAAGYLPMPEGADGAPVSAPSRPAVRGTSRRVATQPSSDESIDMLAFATALFEGGWARVPEADVRVAAPPSLTEHVIGSLAPRLPAGQARLLATAIEEGSEVVIDYAARTGGLTRRTVGELELVGASLHAWCELRQDDRVFTVSRIRSVHPAG